ncbi:MAG: aldo/keto reductase [Rhodoluna sp.]|nr:aldo/keto reductase [Rhodoluna sp.]MBP6186672.1 aldo/keto reductase [Rhodoluna sp.]
MTNFRDKIGDIGFGSMYAQFNGIALGSEEAYQSVLAALHVALDNGVRLLDTADIYASAWNKFGENELMVADALRTWNATPEQKAKVVIATKAGITRKPGEVWGRNASVDYLLRAAEASAGRLGVSKIAVWQHHRLDPNMPFEQQVENLDALRQREIVEHIGVSNYSAKQLRRALEILGTPAEGGIVSVQNQLNPVYRQELDVLEVCEEFGVVYLPWSPSKGVKDLDGVFGAIAQTHGCSTHAVAMAWLRSLSPSIVPIPGVTRRETVLDNLSALKVTLSADELVQIEKTLPATQPMDAELLTDQPKI